MKRIITILFFLPMLWQAFPLLNIFSSQKPIFYTVVEEEKPEVKSKEKKDAKDFLTLHLTLRNQQKTKSFFASRPDLNYTSPTLSFVTPPPDIY